MSGQKVIDGLKEALAGNLARVTIDGVTWVRKEELDRLRAALERHGDLRSPANALDINTAIKELEAGHGVRYDPKDRLRAEVADENKRFRALLEETLVKSEEALREATSRGLPITNSALDYINRLRSAVGSLTAPPDAGG